MYGSSQDMVRTGAAALLFAWMCGPVMSQTIDPGMLEYENQCGVCHGPKGRGDGPLAGVLNQKVPDLAVLQKNNNGQLPVQALYDIIEGTKFVRAHGDRAMPIWGKRLNDQAGFFLGQGASAAARQKFVRQRINALIGYVGKLQIK